MIADEPARWAALGFTVDGDCCQLGAVRLRFSGLQPGCGIVSWSLREITGTQLDGLPTTGSRSPLREPAPAQPNGVTAIDHVVAISPELDRTVSSLQAAGLPLRRIRELPSASGTPRQAFFRLGAEILEVVPDRMVLLTETGRPACRGLALASEDLEHTVAALGHDASPIRDAVQPGRRIASVRRSAGLQSGRADQPLGRRAAGLAPRYAASRLPQRRARPSPRAGATR